MDERPIESDRMLRQVGRSLEKLSAITLKLNVMCLVYQSYSIKTVAETASDQSIAEKKNMWRA